jgi:hypothetical protein
MLLMLFNNIGEIKQTINYREIGLVISVLKRGDKRNMKTTEALYRCQWHLNYTQNILKHKLKKKIHKRLP